jgi:hypothetical protein
MKRVYLLIFIGVIAIVVIAFSVISFDPKNDTWVSLLIGVAVGFLIVKAPSIISYFKAKQQKSAK